MKKRHIWFMQIMIWMAVLAVILPLTLLVFWSFTNRWPVPNLLPNVFSLRGWDRLLSGYFNIWQVMVSSIILSLVVGSLATLSAAMAARAVCFYEFRGKKLISGLAMLPIIVPVTVFGMGSHIFFIRLGINNTIGAVILGHLVITLPFAYRTMLETTRLTSRKLEEQARVLGASPGKAFIHGTIPVLAPGLISSLSVSFLLSFAQYFLTLIMGGGKVKTLAILIMPLIGGSDRTISSVFSLAFMGSAMIVFLFLQHLSIFVARAAGKQLGGKA